MAPKTRYGASQPPPAAETEADETFYQESDPNIEHSEDELEEEEEIDDEGISNKDLIKMLLKERKEMMKMFSKHLEVKEKPAAAPIPPPVIDPAVPTPTAAAPFEFKPVPFTAEQIVVFKEIKKYFPLILAESEFSSMDDPFNRKTLSKIDADLIIHETFDSSGLIHKIQAIINNLEQQGIPSKNWSKGFLQHLEATFRNTILASIASNTVMGWSSIGPYDQYKLILYHLFASFNFKLYHHESLNQLSAIGLKKNEPLKPAMIKLLKQAEQVSHSFHMVATKMVNWSSMAEPMLAVDTIVNLVEANTYSSLSLAIDLIPDTIMVKSALCFHKYPTVNNPRFKTIAPACTCDTVDELHAFHHSNKGTPPFKSNRNNNNNNLVQAPKKFVSYTCHDCQVTNTYSVPFNFIRCLRCDKLLKKPVVRFGHNNSQKKQGFHATIETSVEPVADKVADTSVEYFDSFAATEDQDVDDAVEFELDEFEVEADSSDPSLRQF